MKRTGPIKRVGAKAKLWQKFSNQYAKESRNEEGLIKCQDWKLGLPRCGIAIERPDLHHIEGRDNKPHLYFEKSNLVWLVRACHQKVHDDINNSRKCTESEEQKDNLDEPSDW